MTTETVTATAGTRAALALLYYGNENEKFLGLFTSETAAEEAAIAAIIAEWKEYHEYAPWDTLNDDISLLSTEEYNEKLDNWLASATQEDTFLAWNIQGNGHNIVWIDVIR